jgi:pimeloyl-ACP methyl ester carboxylesterase
MTTKIPMRDLVVILPGITGSVLQKDGRDVWGVSKESILDILRTGGKSLQALKLEQDDLDSESLGDGIRATRLVENVSIIPGLVKIDGYTNTTKMITDNFSNIIQGDIYNDSDDKAANFYHFPYDWRRDNRVAGKILKKLLDKRLKCWREHSGNKDAKVILLAHSMGGLISRYYLEVLGGWMDCKALFTFGTPYRGSLSAVDSLANGFKKGPFDLTEVLRSLNSIYQLLPRYKALKIGEEFYRVAESPVDLPGIDRAKARDALAFYDEIDDAADVNRENSVYRDSFVTCPIVGVVQPTKQSAEFINGVVTTSEALPAILRDRPSFGDGDGTVPQVSATPVQMNDVEMLAMVDYIAESHGSLQNQSTILLSLLKSIQAAQVASVDDVRGALKEISRGARSSNQGIGLAVEDLYLLNEPIHLRAKVSGNTSFDLLRSEIICVSHDRPPIVQNFTMEGDSWVLTTDSLAAGVYRVKVQTDNPNDDALNPVNNLFEVANVEA